MIHKAMTPLMPWYIAVRDQGMVESGMTEGGKNTARSCQFEVFNCVNEHNNTNTKPQAEKKQFLKSSQKKNSS